MMQIEQALVRIALKDYSLKVTYLHLNSSLTGYEKLRIKKDLGDQLDPVRQNK